MNTPTCRRVLLSDKGFHDVVEHYGGLRRATDNI